jgi:cytochrome b6
MYSIHVLVLPLLTVVLVSLHLIMSQILGSSIPVGTKQQGPPLRFFPNFLYRDLVAWCVGFIVLLSLATMLPWPLGEKADPLASAPVGVKPEWYFLPLFQTLKIVPPSVFGLNGELLVNMLVGITSGLWLVIPFIDFRSRSEQKSPIFTTIGVLLILYLAFTIIAAYLTS